MHPSDILGIHHHFPNPLVLPSIDMLRAQAPHHYILLIIVSQHGLPLIIQGRPDILPIELLGEMDLLEDDSDKVTVLERGGQELVEVGAKHLQLQSVVILRGLTQEVDLDLLAEQNLLHSVDADPRQPFLCLPEAQQIHLVFVQTLPHQSLKGVPNGLLEVPECCIHFLCVTVPPVP